MLLPETKAVVPSGTASSSPVPSSSVMNGDEPKYKQTSRETIGKAMLIVSSRTNIEGSAGALWGHLGHKAW